MLEFRGEVSDKCKNYLLKKNAIAAFLGALVPIILLSLCLIMAYVKINKFVLWMLVLTESFLILVLILAFLSPYIYYKKVFENMLPKIIRISEEGIIDSVFETSNIRKSSDDIKRIIDFEDCYYIVLKFPKTGDLVCQKNLMVAGNIIDFERIFYSKIIRK